MCEEMQKFSKNEHYFEHIWILYYLLFREVNIIRTFTLCCKNRLKYLEREFISTVPIHSNYEIITLVE